MNRPTARRISVVLVISLLAFALMPLSALADSSEKELGQATQETGRVVVQFAGETSTESLLSVAPELSMSVIEQIDSLGMTVLEVPAGQEAETAEWLRSQPGVSYAEPDGLVEAAGTPNDTYYAANQWNMNLINGPAGWEISTGSAEISLAIIDTGIDLDHPEFAGRIVPGYDFFNKDDIAQDDHGHGTHVAGIAAASGNNGFGVAGVNWGSNLMPLKILDNQGRGYMSSLAAAIVWATDHGARVVNMSIASLNPSEPVRQAIDYAYERGVVLVAASGNSYEGGNPVIYPAAFDHVIGVASVGSQNEHANYSSAGAFVDVAAPGGHSNLGPSIYSTLWQNGEHTYTWAEGTSMAAPHVTGLAALVLSVNPALTSDEVAAILTSSAVDLGAPGRDDLFGFGRIDVRAALWAARPRTPAHFIYAEAETGRLRSPLSVGVDTGASSCRFVAGQNANAGAVDILFQLDEAEEVFLWGLIRPQGNAGNVLYVTVDRGPEMLWNVQSGSSWIWGLVSDLRTGRVPSFNLASGRHQVRVRMGTPGTGLDAIAVGNDPDAMPETPASCDMQFITNPIAEPILEWVEE